MNNVLATRFLRGELDGKTRRQQTNFKKMVARLCNKPHHRYRVSVRCEWWPL